VGFVSSIKGKWVRVRDKKALEYGDEIFSGTTVRTEKSTSNYIKVNLFDGGVWDFACTARKPCDEGSYPIKTPAEVNRGLLSFFTTYFDARKRVPVIFTIARAAGPSKLNEAVIFVNQGELDLSPAFNAVSPGRLRVTLSDPEKPLDSSCIQNVTHEECFSREIDWPGESTLRVDSAAPGIYALDVQTEDGESLGPPSAILLVESKDAPRIMGEFVEAQRLASKWYGIDSSSIRQFLVQALYAIEMEYKR
jgi:hypothetical protein